MGTSVFLCSRKAKWINPAEQRLQNGCPTFNLSNQNSDNDNEMKHFPRFYRCRLVWTGPLQASSPTYNLDSEQARRMFALLFQRMRRSLSVAALPAAASARHRTRRPHTQAKRRVMKPTLSTSRTSLKRRCVQRLNAVGLTRFRTIGKATGAFRSIPKRSRKPARRPAK